VEAKAHVPSPVACLVALWLAFVSVTATAAEVQIRHAGLLLNAHLLMPEEGGLDGAVTILVHDTLGSQDDTAIVVLQKALLSAGHSSLAITLGLLVDNRQGPFACARPHLHQNGDAVTEIAAWVQWLRDLGARRINLLGLGRGANQAAWYLGTGKAAEQALNGGSVLLIRPPVFQPDQAGELYLREFGYPLEPLLRHARRMVRQDKPRSLIYRLDFLGCHDTAVSAASLLSYYASDRRRHTPVWLRRISNPALVVLDPQSPATPALAAELAPLASANRLQLVQLPDVQGAAAVEALRKTVLGYLSQQKSLLADSAGG
jgi:hypothetical protein